MSQTHRRRLTVFVLLTLFAGLHGVNVGLAAIQPTEDRQARAGIEREGDIPLPATHA